ncbi:MAG: hypothetical protein IJY67_08290 [Paludibacteraceae bacterium]|nr:hypothetical protein [Paludibacteraceae bacterium]
MKKILLFFISLGVSLVLNAQTKTINVIPENAKIIQKGLEVGQGSYTFKIKKEDYVIFRLSAPGYIDKTVRIYKTNKSKTITYQLEVDEAYNASEANSDLANKSMTVNVKDGISIDEAWKRIIFYTSDLFPDMEILDKSSGWLRSAWIKQDFVYSTIRTRIEIKEVPGQDNLKYRVKLQSEYAWHECGGGDECFKQWDRVLKAYDQAIRDLVNALQ